MRSEITPRGKKGARGNILHNLSGSYWYSLQVSIGVNRDLDAYSILSPCSLLPPWFILSPVNLLFQKAEISQPFLKALGPGAERNSVAWLDAAAVPAV